MGLSTEVLGPKLVLTLYMLWGEKHFALISVNDSRLYRTPD